SRHCAGCRRLRTPEKERREFHRALPVSCREIAFVCRASDQADLSLLWLWRGWRRFQVRYGDGEVRVSGGDSHRRGKMWNCDSKTERAFARRTERKSTTLGFGGDAPRSAIVLRETTGRDARRQSRAGLSRRSRHG